MSLPESPDCTADFGSLSPDALVLRFESMVDARDDALSVSRRTKCDLIAVEGDDDVLRFVLVEVKGGKRGVLDYLRTASDQLAASKVILENELSDCQLGLPAEIEFHAFIVARPSQQSINRGQLNEEILSLRRRSGLELQVVRCGEPIKPPSRASSLDRRP